MAKGEKCSFCGRGENEVRLLMPGRDGCICDECAEQAYLLSEEYLHKKKKASSKWTVSREDLPKPEEIKTFLDQYVIGQDDAKRYLSVPVGPTIIIFDFSISTSSLSATCKTRL